MTLLFILVLLLFPYSPGRTARFLFFIFCVLDICLLLRSVTKNDNLNLLYVTTLYDCSVFVVFSVHMYLYIHRKEFPKEKFDGKMIKIVFSQLYVRSLHENELSTSVYLRDVFKVFCIYLSVLFAI